MTVAPLLPVGALRHTLRSIGFRMGRPETDIAENEISRSLPAERELEALRAALADQVAARHEAQVRVEQLEQEVEQRDRIIAEGELTAARLRESKAGGRPLFVIGRGAGG